jgi:hypothetical protein
MSRRSNRTLNGATPADRAGIKIEGKNKRLTLIQNASKKGKQGRGSGFGKNVD